MAEQFKILADESLSLSGDGSDTLVFDIPDNAVFECKKILFNSTGIFKITEIKEVPSGKHFLTGSLHSAQLADNTKQVKISGDIPMGILFQNKLHFKVTDTSSSTNNIYIALVGIEATGA